MQAVRPSITPLWLHVELAAPLLNVLEVFCCPYPDAAKGRSQAQAEMRAFVFNLWRRGMDNPPHDQRC
jgi:hypothetical protein